MAMAMKVLLTGGSSLLGRTTARLLIERGDEVTCFQRSASGVATSEVRGDVRDRAALLDASRGHDGVLHLAALVGPRLPYQGAYDVNVTGTVNAVEAAARCGRFVHVSSTAVGFAGGSAMGEGVGTATYAGSDVYATTKAIAERYVLDHLSVPTVVIRPHLVWGPGDTQLVERIVTRVRARRLRLPDHGRALIDTTYLDDAAAALVAALDHAQAGEAAVGRAWIVTGDDPRPLAELVGGILRAAGMDPVVPSVPAPLAAAAGWMFERWWRGSEPPLTYFSARQLSLAHWFDQREVQAALGWTPRVSVAEGLIRLTRWFKETARVE